MSNRRKSKYERLAQKHESRQRQMAAHQGHSHGGMATMVGGPSTMTEGANKPVTQQVERGGLLMHPKDAEYLDTHVNERGEIIVAADPGTDEVIRFERTEQGLQVVEEVEQPANLAQAIEWGYEGLNDALYDPQQGHKQIADRFPFTSESSVRRWRKANGVVIGK